VSSMECVHEDRVLSAVLAGRWPSDDEQLVAHTERCEICREVAEVAVVLRADHEQARREVHVPVAGQVWWRSAVRARLESTQAATRPMAWLHGVTAAITIGILLAVIGVAWPTIVETTGWAREAVTPLVSNGEVSGLVSGILRQTILIAVAAAACLLLAPVLLYFVLSDEGGGAAKSK
jgi:hypothetical protein